MRSRFFLAFALAVVACDDDDPGSGNGSNDAGMADSGSEMDSGVSMDSGVMPMVCAPTTVPCQDESIQQLALLTDPSPDEITDESTGTDKFLNLINSTGGGLNPTQSYVYARFTETGLEKVEIGDEAALESTDWDIAFRRFVVRLNSGVSGPSCVQAARTAPDTDFDALTTVPDDLIYRSETYFTDTCEYVADSGIGSPATAMISFWDYRSCVEMTGNVFILQLADGSNVKLEVLSYYLPENQEVCNDTGSVPFPSGSGNIRIQWAYVD